MSDDRLLPITCSVAELVAAIDEVQGRARTNRLDNAAATALAGLVLEDCARVGRVAEALGCRFGELEATGAWCWTATSLRDGVHLQVNLRLGPNLQVSRGPLSTWLRFGRVSLTLPEVRRG